MWTASAPLAETAAALRSGRRDLLAYIEEVCDRVEAADPVVQALLPEPERRARLRREAAALQDRFPDPGARPPLFGIPVGVKDLFAVNGFPTGAGSRLPPELFAAPEAAAVARLRAAGALVLGKTHMDEFAYAEPAPTRNPHNPDHTPGGSSSGSAAAVAAGFCPLALGSQTTRSTIGPAAFCGVVGFKPSFGRISTAGMVLLSPSLDTVGLLAQDVAGASLAAGVLCDGWRAGAPDRRPVLGVPEGVFLTYMMDEARAAYAAQLAALRGAGYLVRPVPLFADSYVESIYPRAIGLLHGEMAAVHASWFAAYGDLYRPRTARGVHLGLGVGAGDLAAARAGGPALRSELAALMGEHCIDLWVTPASAGPAPAGLEMTGWGGMTIPWSYAGLPAVTVPAGRAANGLPLGLQFVGRFMADADLLAWAEGLAAALPPT